MLRQNDKILSEVLVKGGLLSSEDLAQHSQKARSSNEALYDYLIVKDILNESQIVQALAQVLGLQTINLRSLTIDPAVIEKVPVKFAWYYKFIPIKIDGKILELATASPLDVKTQDEIRVNLGLEPKVLLATATEVDDALKKSYGLASDTISDILAKGKDVSKAEEDSAHWIEDVERKSEDPSVSKLVNQIILEAYQKRATDIHIEPYRTKVRLRYRIDGVLVDANLPGEAKQLLAPILSRIKIMSNLVITEKRLPQDGSAIVKTKDQTLDLRVSTIPTPLGESMVIRILPSKVMLLNLEKLGFNQENAKLFRDLIKKPHGIVFVTGPTGSGKTTTLYACLNEINDQKRKIITIEDPIEYEMEGITQIQVNSKVNLDFARGLRSVLRHDPDIIMVGEVRDLETAEIAIRTALTGHLVFSTLHTNDAASGITRLVEMGVEPYLVASSIEAFIAQRLVRIICPNCKEEDPDLLQDVKEEIASSLKIKDLDKIKIYKGKGCPQCNGTGFYGRTAIYETLLVNDIVKTAILEKPRADFIKMIAMEQGMRTLRQDGWKNVLEGITSVSEIMNVTAKDEFLEEKDASKGDDQKKLQPLVEQAQVSSDDKNKKKYPVKSDSILSAKNEYSSRIYPRLDEKINIRYKKIEISKSEKNTFVTDEVEYSTTTIDISAGGLQFGSADLISIGTIMELKMYLLDNESSIDCLARVCRVEEDVATNAYACGAYFLDITSGDRVKIKKYVEERLKV